MDAEKIKKILEQVEKGEISSDEAYRELKELPFTDLGFAKIDNHRQLRTGYPEVIFCQGKTPDQVRDIFNHMKDHDSSILGTRATPEMYKAVQSLLPGAKYNEMAKTITLLKKTPAIDPGKYIGVITAGTSDIPVAEEAAITAEIFGNRVERVFDVGVAGIHRLYRNLPLIRGARIIVVVAGMEGALPSIVGGLVDKPVIAVPTSVGYGANFNGLAALLGMLTSCASGVSVVNIDNGFGAGYMASIINKLD
ncbi:MAG: nickel pincer cofactor biosynthesis protein LarB [Bacteroidales bacterium]